MLSILVSSLVPLFLKQAGAINLYGADWDGPVPTDDDANRVVVENLPPLLSPTQQRALTDLLPSNTPTLSEHWMIDTYTIAKTFVHRTCS